MNRILLWLIAVVVIFLGGFYLLRGSFSGVGIAEPGRVQGVISGVDLQRMAVDGPAVITVKTVSGKEVVVHVPSMGLPFCAAADAIADVSSLKVGDAVEVAGKVDEEGVIVPCESKEHYLRVNGILMKRHSDTVFGFSFQYRESPDGYLVQEPPAGANDDPNFKKAVIFMLKSDYDDLKNRQGGEGPPTINVLVFENPKKLAPVQWANENKGISNIELKRSEPAEYSLFGARAIRYGADGLYLSDNVIATHGNRIYFVSGFYMEENSTIRRDFESFLNSFKFIPAERNS